MSTNKSPYTIGLIGIGCINRTLYEYAQANSDFQVEYVYVRSDEPALPVELQVRKPSDLVAQPVDLCVEAATPDAVQEVGPSVLRASDLAILSGSAFAHEGVQEEVTDVADASGTDIYLPHAALLGIDGLTDMVDIIEEVSITATKGPDQLDLNTDEFDERMVYFEGPTRGLCTQFPQEFNSHATVALASLGLDATRSELVIDPDTDTSYHVIRASGDGFDLEVHRDSILEDDTGNYTAVSTWGSVRRILGAGDGLRFV